MEKQTFNYWNSAHGGIPFGSPLILDETGKLNTPWTGERPHNIYPINSSVIDNLSIEIEVHNQTNVCTHAIEDPTLIDLFDISKFKKYLSIHAQGSDIKLVNIYKDDKEYTMFQGSSINGPTAPVYNVPNIHFSNQQTLQEIAFNMANTNYIKHINYDGTNYTIGKEITDIFEEDKQLYLHADTFTTTDRSSLIEKLCNSSVNRRNRRYDHMSTGDLDKLVLKRGYWMPKIRSELLAKLRDLDAAAEPELERDSSINIPIKIILYNSSCLGVDPDYISLYFEVFPKWSNIFRDNYFLGVTMNIDYDDRQMKDIEEGVKKHDESIQIFKEALEATKGIIELNKGAIESYKGIIESNKNRLLKGQKRFSKISERTKKRMQKLGIPMEILDYEKSIDFYEKKIKEDEKQIKENEKELKNFTELLKDNEEKKEKKEGYYKSLLKEKTESKKHFKTEKERKSLGQPRIYTDRTRSRRKRRKESKTYKSQKRTKSQRSGGRKYKKYKTKKHKKYKKFKVKKVKKVKKI